jgi:hypothetical protein
MRRCEAWVQASKTGNDDDWESVQCRHCNGCALNLVRGDGFLYASISNGVCREPEVDYSVLDKRHKEQSDSFYINHAQDFEDDTIE